jgi:hypothetical protein
MPDFAKLSTAVAVPALLLAVFLLARRHTEVRSMHCQKLGPAEVAQDRTRLEQLPRYVPGDKGRGTVQFQFNLSPKEVDESLFVIFSARSRTAVYRGPYLSRVTVEIDDKMAADNSYDSLEFHLLQLKHRQVCTWINERGEPYWRLGAQIAIKFLPEQALDQEGLPKNFDVEIR